MSATVQNLPDHPMLRRRVRILPGKSIPRSRLEGEEGSVINVDLVATQNDMAFIAFLVATPKGTGTFSIERLEVLR